MRQQTDTLVIGGGQAGLAAGYHLTRAGVPFLIVDANERTGDSWRNRWDSLRLFTPNQFNSLPGLQIQGDDWGFPTKDEVGDYLESYAEYFELPIRHGVTVDSLERVGDGFVATADGKTFEARNVIVAMANFQEPRVPEFAGDLDTDIFQIHMADYQSPSQLKEGGVLVVGLGNSGSEIAKELVAERSVWLSGEPSAVQPFRPEGLSGRLLMPFMGKVVLNGILRTSNPLGRKALAKMIHKGTPLLRVKPKDLVAAGVTRVGRTVGVVDGKPEIADGSVLDVSNVVWCTGFQPGFEWVKPDVFDESGQVRHERGVVPDVPGLYFIGLKFLYSALSDTLFAIGRDAGYVVTHLVTSRPRVDAETTV